jgi:LysM repeat protein
VTERLLAAGYPLAGDLSLGGFRSENITSGNETKSAQDAVNGWTGDAPHLTTMISSDLTEIGAGVSINAGRVYYVIDCALPTTNGLAQPAAATAIAAAPTLSPGGGVVFPVVLSTPNANGDIIHEVKAGQSLWQIAIAYETKIDEIKRLNNLFTNDIYPGEKLVIRMVQLETTSTPLESATVATTASATSVLTATATVTNDVPSATATIGESTIAASTSQIMSAAIGVVTVVLLGAIFMFLGDPKKGDGKEKRLR